MNKENIYTSTGIKLLHHPLVLQKLITRNIATPISLQIAPTSRCNLNCVFCSNRNREKHEDLDVNDLYFVIHSLIGERLKSVEWTGGGDPTMYNNINECIRFCKRANLDQGFITNGILLNETIDKKSLDFLKWIRISMNCLDYVDSISIPQLAETILGFSYVMNENTTDSVLQNLEDHVKRYKPKYVRIVPNCQATDLEQVLNNEKYSFLIKSWGEPYFYQGKEFKQPKHCYWGYFKPFILHDGWVYPCSSVVLNLGAEERFHEKYRWCRMTALPDKYQSEIKSFPTGNCNHCVFTKQNNIINGVIEKIRMENFI